MPRSAAQKAVTRRMIAAKRGGRRAGRGAARGPRRRGGRKHRIHSLTDIAGAATTAYGLAGPKQPGWSWDVDPRTGESVADRVHNITQAVPIFGKDPNMAAARTTVATGAALVIGGRAARMLGLRSPVIKLGRFRIRLWG